MTRIFADAAYFVGLSNRTDPHHGDSVLVQTELKNVGHLARRQDLFLSDLVLLETAQKLLADCGFTEARTVFRDIERNHTVLKTRAEDVSKGFYELCSKYGTGTRGKRLGLIDAVSVLLMRRHKIGLILSTDGAFDRIPALQRIWVHNVAEFQQR